jgi:hypothetical protein
LYLSKNGISECSEKIIIEFSQNKGIRLQLFCAAAKAGMDGASTLFSD